MSGVRKDTNSGRKNEMKRYRNSKCLNSKGSCSISKRCFRIRILGTRGSLARDFLLCSLIIRWIGSISRWSFWRDLFLRFSWLIEWVQRICMKISKSKHLRKLFNSSSTSTRPKKSNPKQFSLKSKFYNSQTSQS